MIRIVGGASVFGQKAVRWDSADKVSSEVRCLWRANPARVQSALCGLM